MKKIIVALSLLSCLTLFTNTSYAMSTLKVSAPKVSTPKVSTPKVSTPKVSTPKVSTPNVSTPKVSTPNISTPKVSTPNASTPKVSNSQQSASQNSTKYKLSRPSSSSDIKSSSSLVENTLRFRKHNYNTLSNDSLANKKFPQSTVSNHYNSSVARSNMISDELSDTYSNTSFKGVASNDILRTVLLVELLSHPSRTSHASSIQSKNEEPTTKSETTSSKDDTTRTSETSTNSEDSHSSLLGDILLFAFLFVLFVCAIIYSLNMKSR